MRASPWDIVELVVGDEHAGSERATRKAVLDQCIQTLGQLREDMRAAANKGARLVEAIQFMEDIKGWDTGEAGELSTKLTFSKKVKAFAEFPEAEQGTIIRRPNQK
ncbi:hypothetical protein CBS147346_2965 [Aspergillus niger]|nr:hypothetical protein CBS147346_2965 [Aspergillus niger]